MRHLVASLWFLWVGSPTVFGDQHPACGFPAPRPGPHSLFNPTPASLMRDFETDRPDTTESPRTVPAGHFQVELGIHDYSRSSAEGISMRSELFAACNLKMGLLENMDVQFVFDIYARQTQILPGADVVEEGYGDLTVRLKVNLWGNDEGDSAMGYFLYLRFPAKADSGDRRPEGGLILPYSVELGEGRSLGLMAQFDLANDDSGKGHALSVLHSVVLGIPLGEGWASYLEYFGVAGLRYDANASAGFTYAPVANLQYDIGVRVGLNRHAKDLGVFTGVSVRY